MKDMQSKHEPSECKKLLLPVNDALDILRGKWKIPIVVALYFGNRRFKELQRQVEGITPKMLSKELRELEMNELVIRTVRNTVPVTVEYKLSDYGMTLEKVIMELKSWGTKHRKRIIGKSK